MTKKPPRTKTVPFPTKEQVLAFIRESPAPVGKREIARAFRLDAPARIKLKGLLRDLVADGSLDKGRKRRVAKPGALPDIEIVEVTATDADGELIAKPLVWERDGKPPRILLNANSHLRPAAGVGDRILAKLHHLRDDLYEAHPIRRVAAAPERKIGVYHIGPEGGRLRPTEKKDRSERIITPENAGGAVSGELVLAEDLPGRSFSLRHAKVIERLGSATEPRAASLIAIHQHDIPTVFDPAALELAENAKAAPLDGRVDLRSIPLITIDGEDARDFDDAVFAEADADPANKGGWHILVAIADVSWYVRPGDALDKAAFTRGNSVYFPDRVVPMLPEALSNGWCSLRPDEERSCLAVHMWLDAEGNKLRHQFARGLMRSAARMTYTQVQEAHDGRPDEKSGPLLEPVIRPLYGAYESLLKARQARGVLELDLPERKVSLDANGKVIAIAPRPRFDSHKLIEEFMVAANVCAAESLEQARKPCMYRIHDQPSMEKLEALRQFLESLDLKIPKGQAIRPADFNRILRRVEGSPHQRLVNEVILRSQAQASYAPENIGHFGLALRRYAHFTSPIRRYADLLVHRALIAGLGFGAGGLPEGMEERFAEIGQHISATERRAATAERDAMDRFAAAFLADRVGAVFPGRVNGVTRFGLFVELEDTGADGLIPISTLPADYYDHDESRHALVGRRNGLTFRLGDLLEVKLMEASPVTGGLVFQLLAGGAKGRKIHSVGPMRGRKRKR